MQGRVAVEIKLSWHYLFIEWLEGYFEYYGNENGLAGWPVGRALRCKSQAFSPSRSDLMQLAYKGSLAVMRGVQLPCMQLPCMG